MDKIKVTIHQATKMDYSPAAIAKLTSNGKWQNDISSEMQSYEDKNKLTKTLLEMGHESVFEHFVYTFLFEGVSRSFLAQITRHRLASFTASSQHWINYDAENLSYVTPIEIIEADIDAQSFYHEAQQTAIDNYLYLKDKLKVKHEVARQVLTNATRLNLLMTANAREWKWILNQRLCLRNTSETLYVAGCVYKLLKETAPEIFPILGPDCVTNNKCRQKHPCGVTWPMQAWDKKFKSIRGQ